MAALEDISVSVIRGKQKKTAALAQQLLDEGVKPLDIINNGLIIGMTEVGVRFKNNDMYVPDVLMAAKAMDVAMSIVQPLLVAGEMVSMGTVLIGTVKGDLHDIGKNLVIMMLKSVGFTVVDIGINIPPVEFIKKAKETNANIIGMSALLTTTMLHMKDVIELLKEEGLRDKIKVIVGGAPVSQDFADEITADGYAPDAASSTELCKRLMAIA